MNQKYIISFTMVLLALFLAFAGVAAAEDFNYLFHQDTIVTGMVEQDGDNFILQAIDGDQYTITGQDLSELEELEELVGKKVQASGELTVETNENWFKINEIVDVWGDNLDLYALPIEKYAP